VTGDDAEDHAEGGDDVDATHHLKIIDSFALPAWRWDETRGGFEKCAVSVSPRRARGAQSLSDALAFCRSKATPTLAPGPLSKAQYLRDRFNIIKQVILRNEHFCPPTIVDPERADYMKARPVPRVLREPHN